MKEPYFQPETIDVFTRQWQKDFGSRRRAQDQPFLLDQAALLVLDMQDYFLNSTSHAFVPAGPILIPRLNRVIQHFRENERPVIATRHINTREDAARMGTWWKEIISPDHPGSGIHSELDIQPQEILIKSQYDAFYNSNLERMLLNQGISQLVIGGVLTHLCCETTARSAFVRGWEVFFLVDGTATYQQQFHTASLRNLSHGFAVLTTTNQFNE